MPSQNTYRKDETIDLTELFITLKKRKTLILTFAAVFVSIAALYAYVLAKPIYESKAMIEMGQIDDTPLDEINDAKEKLAYRYRLNAPAMRSVYPRMTDISVPKDAKNVLSITTQSYDVDSAKSYIQKVVTDIENAYRDKTQAYIANQQAQIDSLNEDIEHNKALLKKMEKEIEKYSDRIITLSREDAALAGIYALQIGQRQTQLLNLQKYIASLKQKKQGLELSLSPIKIKPTRVVGEIETNDTPVKPKKALILAVALMTGLMLGILAALVAEFFSKNGTTSDSNKM